jgi:hypothetical protein
VGQDGARVCSQVKYPPHAGNDLETAGDDGLTGLLSDKVKNAQENEAEVKKLHAKIGKPMVENDLLSQGLKRRARVNAKR